MDKHKKRRHAKQILTALLATVPTFTYGIQIGWLSPMKKVLQAGHTPEDIPITDSTISWLAAAFPLAAILGIPFFSFSSDRFGRKICIIAMSVLHCISWTIILTRATPTTLIIARVIGGIAAGGCFVVIPAYIKEISEDSWRGTLASLTMTNCKLGVIFVYAIGMATTYVGNQAVYLTVAAVHVLAFCFMPESPNYLLKRGREKKAAATISWLRSLPTSHEEVSSEMRKLREEQRRYEALPRVSLLAVAGDVAVQKSIHLTFLMCVAGLFDLTALRVNDKATFAAVRMTLVLLGVQTLSGSFALMNFAADVFSRAGAKWSPDILALFMGSLQLAGSFATTVTVDRFGRKIPLAISALVMCVCMTTLGTCFLLHTSASWPRVAAVCIALLAYGVGLAPVPMVIMAEVFPYQFRAKMAGVSMAFSFFCSSMTVLYYTPVANTFGEHVVFYTFGAVALFGVIYTVLWVPETKGKSLQEIQQFWRKSEPEPALV